MARRRRSYGDLQNDTGNFGTRETYEHRDPVCGMPVAMDTGFHSSHGGKDFYFCGSTCQQNFAHEPGRYIGEWASDWQNGRQTGNLQGATDMEASTDMTTEFGPTGVPGTGRSQRAMAEGSAGIHRGGYRAGRNFGKNR